MNLDLFLNDNYKVLGCLYTNEALIQGKRIVKLSQSEIANELDISKAKVNGILHRLEDDGFIRMAGAGKYIIYKKGKDVYRYLAQINDKE